ncbi:hypothetical protein M104_2143 [Bacteroides fragilis str. 1007-1-F |uniref:Uncharacterized protein n=1 Tax=Bacteroides fragilis str. 1007-1-F \|nr:hypothetical protein M101_5173 [Bacteroides fragilis str. 1007-1-F \
MQLQNSYKLFRFVTPAFLSSTGKPGYKLFSGHFFVTEISNVAKLLRYSNLSFPVARLRNYKNLVPDYISTARRRKCRACGSRKKVYYNYSPGVYLSKWRSKAYIFP